MKPYVTPPQMADGADRLNELAELYGLDSELLGAVLAFGVTDPWTPEEIAAAEAAVASIERHCTQAGAEIDARLVQRGYTLPLLADNFPVLRMWARAIARYHLHPQREGTNETVGRIERDYRNAMSELGLVAAGKLSLGEGDPLAPAPTDPDGGLVRVVSEPRRFSRKTLADL